MPNYQKIDKTKVKQKCSCCGEHKKIEYRDNFRGTNICVCCLAKQRLAYNRTLYIPRTFTKQVGIKKGDCVKITVVGKKIVMVKSDDDKNKNV